MRGNYTGLVELDFRGIISSTLSCHRKNALMAKGQSKMLELHPGKNI